VLCAQVLRQLQDQLDLSDEWITALSTGPARERVANLLLMLVQFSTEANNDIELLPGEDMAAIVGTTVETVSRVVASLKRRQLLHKVAEGLYRVDEKALHAISREDAG
jgi:CRP-like cAMP-binding protein